MGNLCSSSVAAERPPPPKLQNFSEMEPYPANGKKMRTDTTLEEEYQLGPLLGHGGFSKVRLATRRATGERFACKIIPLPRPGAAFNEHQCSRSAILAEIDVLLDLEHPNVVNLHEYFVWRNRVYLIMDLLRGGELLEALQERGVPYSEADARIIFRQLLSGVRYLHSMGVVHRDLKLDNLLLARPGDLGSLHIADFGFAKKHPRGDRMNNVMKTVCGTLEYMAPEVVRARGGTSHTGRRWCSARRPSQQEDSGSGKRPFARYGPACDLWSCGIILYMLLAGEPPFWSESEPRLLRAIVAGRFSFRGAAWKGVSREAKDLISTLLVVDPAKRLTPTQALSHKWMRKGAAAQAAAAAAAAEQPAAEAAAEAAAAPAVVTGPPQLQRPSHPLPLAAQRLAAAGADRLERQGGQPLQARIATALAAPPGTGSSSVLDSEPGSPAGGNSVHGGGSGRASLEGGSPQNRSRNEAAWLASIAEAGAGAAGGAGQLPAPAVEGEAGGQQPAAAPA